MKKSYLFLILTLLIVASIFLVSSEEINDEQKKVLNEADKIAGASDFKNTTNKFLSNDIIIPEGLQIPARIILGIKQGENLEFSNFIVLLTLWIILLAIIHVLLTIIPLFGEGWKSWAAAVIITILSTMTGTIKQVAEFFFGFGGFFKDQSLLKLALILILLGLFAWGAIRLINVMKHQAKKDANQMAGFNG